MPSNEDNWKHRGTQMRCGTCMWFCRKHVDPEQTGCEVRTQSHAPLGRCRRHAPTLSGFPAVYDGDWCGDHKIDENKT